MPKQLRDLFRTGWVGPQAAGYRVQIIREMTGTNRPAFGGMIGGMKANALQAVEVGRAYLRPKYARAIFDRFDIDANFIYYGEPKFLTRERLEMLLDAAERLNAEGRTGPEEDEG